MTTDEKLDKLLENQNELFIDLRVHIAKDEDQWRRIADTEDELRVLTTRGAAISKRHTILLTTLSGGVATIASVLTKAFL